MREFDTGATRDDADDKIDYDGFLSPGVIERYGIYMHKHRKQADGKLRASDNWQKGIPVEQYRKSLWRHFMEVWISSRNGLVSQDALCAMMFNVMGMLHEDLKINNHDK
jgi:hypothetical protein